MNTPNDNFRDVHHAYYSKIMLPNGKGFDIVQIDQIVRLQADNNYTRVVLADGKSLFISWTLKRFEKLLALPQFFRTHRSHIIHLNFVKRVVTSNGWWVTFDDKEPVPISKRNREELVRRLVDRSVGEDGSPL